MKNFNKFSMIFLVLTLILISFLPVYAHNDKDIEKAEVVNLSPSNEYELAKELSLKSSSELEKLGLNDNEISEIRNYHQQYVEHLNRVMKLDVAALIANGYTTEQIKVLRNYDGSEEQTKFLAASLNLSVWTTNFVYDNEYTRGHIGYDWQWTGVPAFKLQDAVAVSWNHWAVESNSSNVVYRNVNTGNYYTTTRANFTHDGNRTAGAGHKFQVSMNDNFYYAASGNGSFKVRSDVHYKKDFYYYIAYGHKRVMPSISFSITAGGGDASITFSSVTSIEADYNGSVIAR